MIEPIWKSDEHFINACNESYQQGYAYAIDLERQVSELEDVVASLKCQYENFVDDICEIIFEGENTEIGKSITIERIKEIIRYKIWLEENN